MGEGIGIYLDLWLERSSGAGNQQSKTRNQKSEMIRARLRVDPEHTERLATVASFRTWRGSRASVAESPKSDMAPSVSRGNRMGPHSPTVSMVSRAHSGVDIFPPFAEEHERPAFLSSGAVRDTS